MRTLRTLLGAFFRRPLRGRDLRAFWRGLVPGNDFQATVDHFAPTRFVSRAQEMTDGQAVHVGEGLEVSEEDLHTLPAELQDEFKKHSRSAH